MMMIKNNLKQHILILAIAFITILSTQSCSKDDIDPVLPPEEIVETLELEGQWNLQSVNFLDDGAAWDNEVAFNSDNYLGWAPFIYEKAQGFSFYNTKVLSDQGAVLGNKFSLVVGEDLPLDANETYWYWNYKEEQQSFNIAQLNTTVLPYDLSISNISEVQMENDGDKIIFKATLNSRIPGEDLSELRELSVEITITRGAPGTGATVLLKGEAFEMPEVELTEAENQAALLAELKVKMGFNSSYIYSGYTDPSYGFGNISIDKFDWDTAIFTGERDETDFPSSAPFIVIDNNNVFYSYIGWSGVSHNEFNIKKENDLYTITGEYVTKEHLYFSGYSGDDIYSRVRATFNTETKETTMLLEFLMDGSAFWIHLPAKWIQDEEITTHSFEDVSEYFPDLEL